MILDVSKAQVRNKLRHKLNLERLRLPYIGGYRCFVQSMDSDHQRILLHKPWFRALQNNPRNVHTNLRSAHNNIVWCTQPQPSTATNPQSNHARKAARPSAAKNTRSIMHALWLCRQ